MNEFLGECESIDYSETKIVLILEEEKTEIINCDFTQWKLKFIPVKKNIGIFLEPINGTKTRSLNVTFMIRLLDYDDNEIKRSTKVQVSLPLDELDWGFSNFGTCEQVKFGYKIVLYLRIENENAIAQMSRLEKRVLNAENEIKLLNERYTRIIQDISKDDCSICLENINSDPLKILDCNHIFHAKCIDQCIELTSCPICRREIK
jgi:hypothetical protein